MGVIIVNTGIIAPEKTGQDLDILSEKKFKTRNIIVLFGVNTRGKQITGLIKFIWDKQSEWI